MNKMEDSLKLKAAAADFTYLSVKLVCFLLFQVI